MTPADRPATVACPIADLALLRIDGPDAQTFLQGQLSSDVAALGAGDAQWSSYNSPKGRMLASLLLWREGDGACRALLAADLAEPIVRRLRMFVLRAKARIEAPAGIALLGVAGPDARSVVQRALFADVAPGRVTPAGDPGLAATARADDATAAAAAAAGEVRAVGLPDGRIVVVVPAAARDAVMAALCANAVPGDAPRWERDRIRAGVPLVTSATTDQFVPQMLNWDALGGVSFRKGCYPGQEIVARTHYLGRLKERLYAWRLRGGTRPGARLYAAAFGEQPCGTVVNAAPDADGTSVLLAVVQRSAADAGEVHLDAPGGTVLAPLPLPYPLPEPAPPRGRIA